MAFDMSGGVCRFLLAKDLIQNYLTTIIAIFHSFFLFFLQQNIGIDKGDIPDLTKAPSSLLDALEGHLATLEGRKGSAANTPTQSSRYNKTFLIIAYSHTTSFLSPNLGNCDYG